MRVFWYSDASRPPGSALRKNAMCHTAATGGSMNDLLRQAGGFEGLVPAWNSWAFELRGRSPRRRFAKRHAAPQAGPNSPHPPSLDGPILRVDGNQVEGADDAHLGHMNQAPGFGNLSAPSECLLAMTEVALPLSVEADLEGGHEPTVTCPRDSDNPRGPRPRGRAYSDSPAASRACR
jgi:hypothetical protein